VNCNQVALDARLLKRSALRYTPAGIPAIDLLIGHKSIQIEAGVRREARCEVEAVAIGDVAVKLSAEKLNQPLQISGFLTQRSVKDRKLVLHVVSAATIAGAISSGTEQNRNQGEYDGDGTR
jgi:primosomal replication protein N